MKDSLNFKLLAFYCKEKAFTLVELIVVIIILAIL
ncbi:MAG: prepilin-type N-terminal cleavage/methylation domain-containing protein [Candidatus Peribacteria bacterium]|nr:prepilin-type N-terminal cleavage/methylation domain-containing protein [Candidatus Peribacteria bacterium]